MLTQPKSGSIRPRPHSHNRPNQPTSQIRPSISRSNKAHLNQSISQSTNQSDNQPNNMRIKLIVLIISLFLTTCVIIFNIYYVHSNQPYTLVPPNDPSNFDNDNLSTLPVSQHKTKGPFKNLVDKSTNNLLSIGNAYQTVSMIGQKSIVKSNDQPTSQSIRLAVITSHANTAAAKAIQTDPRLIDQPIKLSINQPNRPVSDFDLFISTIINRYQQLPRWIAVIDQSLTDADVKPMINLLVDLLNDQTSRQSIDPSIKFINLQPGDYQCDAYIDRDDHHSINQNIVIDHLYRTGRSINQNITDLYHQIVFDQSINPLSNLPLRLAMSCADSARSFVVHRDQINQYRLSDYKSMLRTCRDQSINQSNNQCDFSKLIPHLYWYQSPDQSINKSTKPSIKHALWLPPLLSAKSTYQFYQSRQLITQSISQLLRVEELPVNQSSRHPLYTQITDPLFRQCRAQLIVIPSVDDRIQLSNSQSIEQSERMYDWLQYLPMSLDPQTIQLTIFHHESMKQSLSQTTDLQSIYQSIDDPYTLDLIKQNYTSKNRIRPDVPSLHQSIKQSNWIEPSSLTFLRYLVQQWKVPNSIKCVSIYQSTYQRFRSNNELHDDRLQTIMKIKYDQTIKDSDNQGFLPVNVDGYTCEHDIDQSNNQRNQIIRLLRAQFLAVITAVNGNPADSIKEAFEQAIKQALKSSSNSQPIESSFQQLINQYIPPSFCYYRGDFVFTRDALKPVGNKKLESLHQTVSQILNYVTVQSHDQSINQVDLSKMIDEAIEPLWSWVFHRHSQLITPRFIAYQFRYQPIDRLLMSLDESIVQSAHTCSHDQYQALTSPWDDSEIESNKQVVDWSVKQSNNRPSDSTLAIVSAAYVEDLAWLQSIDPSMKKVVVRQDHPKVDGTVLSYSIKQSIKQSLEKSDSALTNALHLTSKGLCKEGSSYLKFIIEFYDQLPEFIVFVHGQSVSWHHAQPLEQVINNLDWTYIYAQSRDPVRPFYFNLNSAFYSLVRPDHWFMLARYYFDLIGNQSNDQSRFFNGSTHLPELIGFHAAAQFVVNRAAIHRHPRDWWVRAYKFCRYTHMTPTIASRYMEYMWHVIFGEPAIETRHECGVISKQQKCTLQPQPQANDGQDPYLNSKREI